MKWQDALIRAAVAALLALAGALTERAHPGSLSGLVPLGPALGAPLHPVRSELRSSPRLTIPFPGPKSA